VPAGKVIHVILDNYAAHKHAKVRRWLTRHPSMDGAHERVIRLTGEPGEWRC
jgi:hypothetical protein